MRTRRQSTKPSLKSSDSPPDISGTRGKSRRKEGLSEEKTLSARIGIELADILNDEASKV
jgi:hypothetical protein